MGVSPLKHHHNPAHCFGCIDYKGSVTYGTSELNRSYITYENRDTAISRFYNNFFNVLEGFDEPYPPDKISSRFFVDIGASRIFIILFKCIENIGK